MDPAPKLQMACQQDEMELPSKSRDATLECPVVSGPVIAFLDGNAFL